MHFDMVDRVLEVSADRIVTLKQVSRAEEYLQDHFPEFPVLPGVFMIESLVQAGRRLVEHNGGAPRLVLGSVRAVKYGSFVRPGESLRISPLRGAEARPHRKGPHRQQRKHDAPPHRTERKHRHSPGDEH